MLGYDSGSGYTGSESSNIAIGSDGVTGESNVIRIGETAAVGCVQLPCQTATYIAGISGVTVSGTPLPVVINSAGQLGTGISAVGTVTSVTAGTGLVGSPNPIIATGTLSLDTTYTNGLYAPVSGSTYMLPLPEAEITFRTGRRCSRARTLTSTGTAR